MIHDQLTNIKQHSHLYPSMQQAIAFLDQTDLATLEPGIIEIDQKRVFAIVEKYDPKSLDQIIWETHKRYIDIQVIIAGSERMGCLPLTDNLEISTPYNPDRDFTYYNLPSQSLFTVQAGDIVIYEPHDVHAPGLALESNPVSVHKIVLKCLID